LVAYTCSNPERTLIFQHRSGRKLATSLQLSIARTVSNCAFRRALREGVAGDVEESKRAGGKEGRA
jgi:hypothetical protein